MRVLITGGAGFIGSRIALELQKTHDIRIVDDFSSGNFKNLYGFEGEVVCADVSQRDFWENCDDFDAIIHMASITDTTITDQNLVMTKNCTGFYWLLEYIKRNRARLVYASSAAVYGNTQIPMVENRGLKPENIYGFSKLCMDRLALNAIKEGLSIAGLRYFNVYGYGEEFKGKSASMILQLYKQIKEGKKPKLFKFGEQRRDFIYIKDAVRASILCLNSEISGIFNVGSGVSRSFNEIVEIISRNLGKTTEIEYIDCPYEFYQKHTLADITKIKETFGFHPEFSLEEGIKDYISLIESNP
ncbi:MAG: ADP-glyceromanno-heptose 6-epimerase [Aquificaceae bacterium]